MAKIREELMTMKDKRKPEGSRNLVEKDFPETEVRSVRRKESFRRVEIQVLLFCHGNQQLDPEQE